MATTVALLTAIGGCGALDGSSNNPSGGGSGTNGPIEKPKLRVGLLPVVDVAPLYQAVEKGYFREQGLDVEPVVVASGPKAVESVISGEIDIAFTSYPGAFVAQSKGVANLKIVADAYAPDQAISRLSRSRRRRRRSRNPRTSRRRRSR
ncbi:ABC transporter substrate-binding protein [Kibdelosporangium philippinense]|uniref:ABC transporter substrate-binding protein n=1 Tax=Kibdelosporangium philippinense TaxID=211113 RepID=UPI0036120728